MKLQFKWSTLNIVSTGFVLVLIGFAIPFIPLYLDWRIGITIFLLFIFLFFIGLCPLYLKADDEKLIIKRIVGKVSISYDKIQSIKPLEYFSLWEAFRCGSGGFFGFTGYWYRRDIGWFILYATENKKFLHVKTVDRQYVIGCREPEEFVRYVEDKKKEELCQIKK